MGTYAAVQLECSGRAAGLAQAGDALAEMEAVDLLLSNWKPDSAVSSLNGSPPGQPVPVTPELVPVLSQAFALGASTGFAFDPGIGALSEAWGLRSGGRWPAAAELADARAAVGASAFELDERGATLCRNHPAARIDTGGFGKGLALDRAAAALRRDGVSRALLDLGGQLLAVGGPFPVAVADPDHRERSLAVLSLEDASVSSSGDSERSLPTTRGQVGHLLDPAALRPAADFGAVTVVARSGLEADALSTGLFVLGPERGLALARELPGVEALFLVRCADGQVAARMTPGLRVLLAPGSRVRERCGGHS
jgi:thiamine biosynthesis lipoprotein